TGITLGNWLELLKKNAWQVSPEYYHRLAFITALSGASSLAGKLEQLRFGKALDEMKINPTPIFILGHWRTGTTHMHNMLGRDPNNTFSTLYQVLFPDSFLTTGEWGPKALSRVVHEKRI